MKNGDGRTGEWLEEGVISKNAGLFFFSPQDRICICFHADGNDLYREVIS